MSSSTTEFQRHFSNLFSDMISAQKSMTDYMMSMNPIAKYDMFEKEKKDNTELNDYVDFLTPTFNKLGIATKKWIDSGLNDNSFMKSQQDSLLEEVVKLNEYFIQKMSGNNVPSPATENKKDRRFLDDSWQENLFFDFAKNYYLVFSNWVYQCIESNDNVDQKTKNAVTYYLSQFVEALSPSNFIMTNPVVLKKTIEENGFNIIKGIENLKQDLTKNKIGGFSPKQTSHNSFELGQNIATSKGSVVYRNELFELIHYTPVKKNIYQKPILIVPPMINKYYIMDLNENKSMVQYLLKKGVDVFLISWVNPDESLRNKVFEDYVFDGVYTAMQEVEKISGVSTIHPVGYCIGGTLLAMTMAYLAGIGDHRVKDATLLASLIDFSDVGQIGVFIDEDQVSAIEKKMEQTGYFDGKDMAATFNSLRPSDLYWNYIVNNYLLGKEPEAFDVLYWNSDSTRLPEKMHSYYLRNMYLNNLLIVPNALNVKGVPIDLKSITADIYCVAADEDHIVPWKSSYKLRNSFGSKNVHFILSNKGHMMGIIQGSSPVPKKFKYWSNKKNHKNPDHWFRFAKKNIGSWWPNWLEWLDEHLEDKVSVSEMQKNKTELLGEAPGEYVRIK